MFVRSLSAIVLTTAGTALIGGAVALARRRSGGTRHGRPDVHCRAHLRAADPGDVAAVSATGPRVVSIIRATGAGRLIRGTSDAGGCMPPAHLPARHAMAAWRT